MIRKVIHGRGVDKQGRCAHYRSDRDVVGNKCATCGTYWACHLCHEEYNDHPFGRMPVDEVAVICGACGREMDYHAYSAASACPGCGHAFNPGCSLHAPIYFQV